MKDYPIVIIGKMNDIQQELTEYVLMKYACCGEVYLIPIVEEKERTEQITDAIRRLAIKFNGLYKIHCIQINETFPSTVWKERFYHLFCSRYGTVAFYGTAEEIERFRFKSQDIFMNWTCEEVVCEEQKKQRSVIKVLLTGVESCGKTTLTQMLSKKYDTSFTYEFGRDYAAKYYNGQDNAYAADDFFTIAFYQRELEKSAVKHANKITFFDTDAIITQFYCELLCGEEDEGVRYLINKMDYDLILFLTPDIAWVKDEIRFMDSQTEREKLSEQLLNMYYAYGYAEKTKIISGNFKERYIECIKAIEELIREA